MEFTISVFMKCQYSFWGGQQGSWGGYFALLSLQATLPLEHGSSWADGETLLEPLIKTLAAHHC